MIGHSVAELASTVVTPALDPTAGDKGAGMALTGADTGCVRDAADLHRNRAEIIRDRLGVAMLGYSVAELTKSVAAPAIDRATVDRAQV